MTKLLQHMVVYQLTEGDALERLILPIYGKGLWSTLYGFLALEQDLQTVSGITFYQHAETPGLGDFIEKLDWIEQFTGLLLFDEAGNPRIEIVRGQVQPGPDAVHQVDGVSGATLTGNGVTNLIQYWTGPHGFGPYLARVSREANGDG